MRLALELAELGKGLTSPNPMVGAVVVKKGRVLGVGYHKGKGLPHAEVVALEDAGRHSRGSTLYVNLEPHCFYGTNPPCTEAILKTGIKRVVIAIEDPNPKVSGKGIDFLKNKGIEVTLGILEEPAQRLNEAYLHFWRSPYPFVALKMAVSLDGFIADIEGNSKWISSEGSLRFIHKTRGEYDGVVVGAGTIRKDNPLLTPRKFFSVRKPKRFIISPRLNIPLESRILKTPPPTIIVTKTDTEKAKIEYLQEKGIEIWRFKSDIIRSFLKRAHKEGIQSLLFEGGGEIASSIVKEGLWDKMILVYSPIILGEGKKIFSKIGAIPINKVKKWEITDIKLMGKDIVVTVYREAVYERKVGE